MSTFSQNLKIESKRKKDNRRTPILEKCPHAKGWVNRVTIITPRKPNSAKRPIIKVFLRKMGRLTAHIPGIGHTLKKYGKVLIRGRGPRDLPGVRYSCVRGVLDFIGLKKKKRRRSIYGAEQNNLTKVRARRKYRFAIRSAERDRVQKENEQSLLNSHVSTICTINRIKEENNFSVLSVVLVKNIKKLLNFSKKEIMGFKIPSRDFKISPKKKKTFPFFFFKKYFFYYIINMYNIQQIFLFLSFFFFKKNVFLLQNNFKFFFHKKIHKYLVPSLYSFNYSHFFFFDVTGFRYFNFLRDSAKYFSLKRKLFKNKSLFLSEVLQSKKYLQNLQKSDTNFFLNKNIKMLRHKKHIFSKYLIKSGHIFFKKKIFLNSYVSLKFSKNFTHIYNFFFRNIFFFKKPGIFKKKMYKNFFYILGYFFYNNNFFNKKFKSYKYIRFLNQKLKNKKIDKTNRSIYFFKKKQKTKLKNFFTL